MGGPMTKNVVLDEIDMKVIEELIDEKGLGGKGFSAALRMIIREWSRNRIAAYRLTEEGREALKKANGGEG